jgi:hypothetical protein
MAKITARFGADITEVEKATATITRRSREAEGAFAQIGKKFTGGRILESVLGGVGLGSGFAIAQKAAELISSHWEKAANAAKEIADSSSRATEAVIARIRINETSEQKLARLQRETDSLRAGADRLSADRVFRASWSQDETVTIPASTEDLVKAAEMVAEAEQNELEIAQLKKAAREKETAALRAQYQAQQKAEEDLADLQYDNALRQLSTEQQLEALRARQVSLRETGEVPALIEAEKLTSQIASLEEKITQEKEKAAEADRVAAEKSAEIEKRAQEELASMAFDRLSEEEQMVQILAQGREAFEKAQKSGLASDQLAVAKLREEYERLKASIEGAKKAQSPDDKFSRIGLTRGEDGKLRRGNRIVSEEDALRTLQSREKNDRESQRAGAQKNKSESLLDKIERHLRPTEI